MITTIKVKTFKDSLTKEEEYVNKRTAEITGKLNKYLGSPYMEKNRQIYYGYYALCKKELDYINVCREIMWELKGIFDKKAKGKGEEETIRFGYTKKLRQLMEQKHTLIKRINGGY